MGLHFGDGAEVGLYEGDVRRWLLKAEQDAGERSGPTSRDADRLAALERENRELKRANEILRKPSAFFAAAGCTRSSTRSAPVRCRADLPRLGDRTVWRLHLSRPPGGFDATSGACAARCTVARLMAAEGLRGVVRGQRHRTTIADTTTELAQDLVPRQFHAVRPTQRLVADFTYVATWRGGVYVAFVIDVFSRRIVGWCAHTVSSVGDAYDTRSPRP